ncbi:MAG: nicotinate phosphoribosyltransferase [Candidatus Heimdallarchaeota archaeon]|nr:nicotinate phosphoribosyltransferase [Candidatus Heimdallarchaeota archaeon]
MDYTNRGLFLDLYELTMAFGFFKQGMSNKTATFELFFRKNPFNGGYTVICGVVEAIEFVRNFGFLQEDIDYLSKLEMFDAEFLIYLQDLEFDGEIVGVREGTVMFPHTPVIQVTGNIIILQLIETGLLNIINFQSLIATKAARICQATQRIDNVMEFGLRRAQGDGGIIGSKAAFVGGSVSTSNVYAGRKYHLKVAGTHGHSWIQSFRSELEAFRKYADIYPDNSILLVDTYSVLQSGIQNAIRVGRELQERGSRLVGIRIDSGDLGWLAIQCAKLLDKNDLEDVKIVLSSDLDEYIIESIIHEIQSSKDPNLDSKFKQKLVDRILWGVGTSLITGSGDGQAALGGVYKLVEFDGDPVMKISENRDKTTVPGKKSLWRLKSKNKRWIADVISRFGENKPQDNDTIFHIYDDTKFITLEGVEIEELHLDLLKYYDHSDSKDNKALSAIRLFVRAQLLELDSTHKRFLNPHDYKISLTQKLVMERKYLIQQHKNTYQ